ncbi:hypothetical protein P3S68_006335 [Capsicum galapagoense]
MESGRHKLVQLLIVMADPDVVEDQEEEEDEGAITEAQLEKRKKWECTRDFRSLSDPPPVCSFIPIRDYSFHKSSGDFAVFPPANHENLYPVHQNHSQSSSPPSPSSPSLLSSSSSFSPSHRENGESSYSFAASDSNVVDPPRSVTDCPRIPARGAGYRGKWLNLGLQVLVSRVSGTGMLSKGLSSARRAVMIILSPFGMAAMLVMFVYFRRRRRLIRGQRGEEELRRTIRAKDERINQLLSQIAEMNQVFVAMHKRNLSKN